VSVSAALVHELILGPDCNPTIDSGEAATAAPAGQEETKQGTAAKTSQAAGWALETFSSCACSLLHRENGDFSILMKDIALYFICSTWGVCQYVVLRLMLNCKVMMFMILPKAPGIHRISQLDFGANVYW
jgi:hypothetical protein